MHYGEEEDEKYTKAANINRNRNRHILSVIGILFFLCMMFYFYDNGVNYDTGSKVVEVVSDAKVENTNTDGGDAYQNQRPKVQVVDHRRERREEEHTTEKELVKLVEDLDSQVRTIKANLAPGHFTETDPTAQVAIQKLQDATRRLMHLRYGPDDLMDKTGKRLGYRILVELRFQETILDFKEKGPYGSFTIELAPSALVPHSIYTFLEIARTLNPVLDKDDIRSYPSAFHRNAGHVLQVRVRTKVPHLAFQEYSPEFPHKKATVGYAGRPSGPAWYVSIVDNSRNHGPGSQQKDNPNEADSCFGQVIEGFPEVIWNRVHKMPGKEFLDGVKKHVLIEKMTILIPNRNGSGEYVAWDPSLHSDS